VAGRLSISIVAAIVTVCIAAPVAAQRRKPARKSSTEQKDSADNLAKARTELIQATKEYKKSLEQLVSIDETNIKRAEEHQAKLTELYQQGIVSKRELDESRQAVTTARARLDDVKTKIKSADLQIAETFEESKISEQLAKAPPPRSGAFIVTMAYLRYNGPGPWSLSDVGKVQGFFSSRFGRALPISAMGQTELHDRMGLDHHNAVDVGVHPDSVEGQALMNYLRSVGIPFLAFRFAVPGAATGPHIHIGRPSHRIKAN
jgi:hypothetical protein